MCNEACFPYCFECKISDIGICFDCAITKDICLNCIAYGEGDYCLNCIRWQESDEGVDLKDDLVKVREWIDRNNHFWKLKYLLSRLTFRNNFIKK